MPLEPLCEESPISLFEMCRPVPVSRHANGRFLPNQNRQNQCDFKTLFSARPKANHAILPIGTGCFFEGELFLAPLKWPVIPSRRAALHNTAWQTLGFLY
jgi:hypothetical protein